MSVLHFCCTDVYRKRIIQLGEQPEKVFNFGSTGVENIKNMQLMSESEIRSTLALNRNDEYACMTFHPVTLEDDTAKNQICEVIRAIAELKDIKFIVTKSNADAAGRLVNKMIEEATQEYDNIRLFDSLGSLKYLSAIKYASFVIGNSSSGLLEVPSFAIPTVNIGDRQKGRERAASVIDCEPDKESILNAIAKARNKAFKNCICNVKNPYEGENTSKYIVDEVEKAVKEKSLSLKKTFYNIQFNI
jgi:GDP/UDP-N,N'-diacetylbacillosamine 2-epimerase (hydrolysing)